MVSGMAKASSQIVSQQRFHLTEARTGHPSKACRVELHLHLFGCRLNGDIYIGARHQPENQDVDVVSAQVLEGLMDATPGKQTPELRAIE